ncbi:MAG: hypothetical protein sL5_10790 [Candidatus Mesenet longicola]|uniref:Uncharacterized protein n=1 Tax=Candidatus Mesenet longicola TaxID=1892558 RepID=A0A8J3HXH6_9RICK|nr:MAG: hypothetical protein sGL2_11080 [Candidatus Mesenet longicola]GHM60086.1 MAG: hypothetical protein sL5_10790 [Candidatus Mesenet longicola]
MPKHKQRENSGKGKKHASPEQIINALLKESNYEKYLYLKGKLELVSKEIYFLFLHILCYN